MLSLTGHNYIGGERRAAGTVEHKSLDASSGEALPYTFIQATPEEVDAAAQAVDTNCETLRPEARILLLSAATSLSLTSG